MTNKLLVVCGQTGTGKTSLAIHLAKKFNGELISADSRQVYKGLNIGTGKDIDEIKKSKVQIWGYDLVDPKKNFSVGNYIRFAQKAISDIQKRGKLPILVGGTGLFIKGVVDGIPTAFVPRNLKLRKNMEEKDANELFEILAQLDPIRAGSLNRSDKLNPRRLIRGIEVASWKLEGKVLKLFKKPKYDLLEIGLQASQNNLSKKIKKRVNKRINDGVEAEIKKLISSGISWDSQSMTSLGYRQWRDYFEGLPAGRQGKIVKDGVIDSWKKEELRYAKRQLTWFKKDLRINWFDSSKKNFIENVEELVKKWYP
ncbi:MAG: tRNA (adenosine(37)-N6)-dimethylallyltransferase MiaA [Patescibacteria group bacterium]